MSKNLSHFQITAGYPQDLAHDLLEGMIPVELANCCFSLLISKKYFALETLDNLIYNVEYKWADKINPPHAKPQTFSKTKQNKTKQKVGGNVHESWSLLRFSPLIIGPLVPEDAPAWHFVLDLKDIVEIVVAPVNSDEYILYLDHYLEHKPVLIWLFGPL